MNWSTQQEKAITERNSNILVAAAAGSGKTAVLVERIIRMVTEEGVPVDSLLVVTFTNAAASEMKEKIREALVKKAKDDPEARRQLDLLPRATISTFHAFALEVIRKFFHVIDLDPEFALCDEAQSTILKQEAMEDLFDEMFARGEEIFTGFLDWYSTGRNMEKVKSLIEDIYTGIMALPDPFEKLEEAVSFLDADSETFRSSPPGIMLKKMIRDKAVRAKDMSGMGLRILVDEGLEKLHDDMMVEYDQYTEYAELAEKGDFAALAEAIQSFERANLRVGKESPEAAAYEDVKEEVKDYRGKARDIRNEILDLIGVPLEDQLEEMHRLVPAATCLRDLLKRFDEIYAEKKRRQKIIDFTDVEHFCLEILRNKEISDHYREKFSYIYIDEYQDTSVLQEAIVDLFAGEDNLFMVGDVKQSIYKFRLAEPEIFQEKYRRYQREEDERSTKIDLNMNFRSKSVILHWINRVFEELMDGYDDDASLHPGIQGTSDDLRPQLVLVDGGESEGKEDTADDEISRMKNTELEALAIAGLIKDNLGKEYYDVRSGETRKLRYRDMVILSRSVVNVAEVYRKVMEEQGIPLFLDDSEGYFDTVEIKVFMSLLRIIDNKYRDISFITCLRSEIFGFSVNELAAIRKNTPSGSYVEAFMNMVEDGEGELSSKCGAVMKDLAEWRKLSLSLPLPDFLWTVLQKSGYYLYAGAMPQGEQRQANLRYLIDRARAYQESSGNSLYGFIGYLEKVTKKKVRVSQVRLLGEKDDVVRLMTIHKSKGLEFPLVIVSGLGKKLNYTDRSARIMFHKDIGLGMYLEDPDEGTEKDTLLYKIIHSRMKEEERQEDIRVLYVAMTRAREKLIMTGVCDDVSALKERKDRGFTSDGSYLEMLTGLPDLSVIPKEKLAGGGKSCAGLQLKDKDVSSESEEYIKNALKFVYPHRNLRDLKSKYSVTDINRSAHQGADIPRITGSPLFMTEDRTPDAADIGNIYHTIMENIDPEAAAEKGAEGIGEQIDQMCRKGILGESDPEHIEPDQIRKFFESDMGRRFAEAAKNGKLYREQPFNMMLDNEGEDMIVQGVIDCFLDEPDGIVLMDYKTGRFDENKWESEEARVKETYGRQIQIYARALALATGKKVKESYLYMFGPGVLIDMGGDDL